MEEIQSRTHMFFPRANRVTLSFFFFQGSVQQIFFCQLQINQSRKNIVLGPEPFQQLDAIDDGTFFVEIIFSSSSNQMKMFDDSLRQFSLIDVTFQLIIAI